jgi:hypothetical protein
MSVIALSTFLGSSYLGEPGIQGIQGLQGAEGLQGVQGQSIQGVQGIQGTISDQSGINTGKAIAMAIVFG